MECKFCRQVCQKAGKQKNGAQKFYCKACSKYQLKEYKYQAYKANTCRKIATLLCEGVGIRGIGRILRICCNTVLSKIRSMAALCHAPVQLHHQEYEIDELRTYISNKKNECWVAYSMARHTKAVAAFTIGRRTKENLQKVTSPVLETSPRKVYTDKWPVYRSLLPPFIHYAGKHCTNYIERHNLNIRTHLKRLSRKTICSSRSMEMLEACLKIYFWR